MTLLFSCMSQRISTTHVEKIRAEGPVNAKRCIFRLSEYQCMWQQHWSKSKRKEILYKQSTDGKKRSWYFGARCPPRMKEHNSLNTPAAVFCLNVLELFLQVLRNVYSGVDNVWRHKTSGRWASRDTIKCRGTEGNFEKKQSRCSIVRGKSSAKGNYSLNENFI